MFQLRINVQKASKQALGVPTVPLQVGGILIYYIKVQLLSQSVQNFVKILLNVTCFYMRVSGATDRWYHTSALVLYFQTGRT